MYIIGITGIVGRIGIDHSWSTRTTTASHGKRGRRCAAEHLEALWYHHRVINYDGWRRESETHVERKWEKTIALIIIDIEYNEFYYNEKLYIQPACNCHN
jgi:hypothetical protein